MERGRHYGLDGLRIAAFALLILYHVALAFSPWHWIVHSRYHLSWLIVPMAAMTPWRLGLLFAVAGYASAMLFTRQGGAGSFALDRSRRLLVPLAFAMVAIVPVELWVRVREAGYPGSLWQFWIGDAWRVGRVRGVELPSWEHLWFVGFLWVYTMLLAAVLAIGGARVAAAMDRAAAWAGQGARLLWAPMAALVGMRLALLFTVPDRMGLLRDWAGHSHYLTLFGFGFLLAQRPDLWRAVHRHGRAAAAVALLCGVTVVAVELRYPGDMVPPHLPMAIDRAARSAMAWTMVLLLFHLADRFLDRDFAGRRTLGRAVFPAYIVHHPAIVVAVWATLPLALGPVATAAIVLATTLATCALAYALARAVPWLGMALGVARPGRSA
jgi:hypothetical protein